MYKNNALIIGAGGFLGGSILPRVATHFDKVFALSLNYRPDIERIKNVEYICGDASDGDLLKRIMTNVDTVYYFLSTSLPSSDASSIKKEVSDTILTLIMVLDSMVENGVTKIVFPSSGGAIYGNSEYPCNEESTLNPNNNYGFGKKMSEEIIEYYCKKNGINSLIFRIGNVYGLSSKRTVNQGAVDIFIEKALKGEKITVWNNALNSLRDYVFIDDLVMAVESCSMKNFKGFNVYNVGSGFGTELGTIITLIENALKTKVEIEYNENSESSVKNIILDISKISSEMGWRPRYSLEQGIVETIKRKKQFLGID